MLDPTSFKYKDSRWKDLFTYIKKCGYDVYPPATKVGECESNYIVVKYSGATQAYVVSSRFDLYDIFCYVPRFHYSELETFVQNVIRDMKNLEPLFKPYDLSQDESYYDESVKGHYVALTYKNVKKN